MVTLWLREETKLNEKRTALTPAYAKELLDYGFDIVVEKSNGRIYPCSEYSNITSSDGKRAIQIVESNSWITDAPTDAFVLGLKELDGTQTFPLRHRHIMFAHCYKNQDGWKSILQRFRDGRGTLLDLEFLTDDNGRRVAAFGHYAGVAGCALGLEIWSRASIGSFKNDKINSFPNLQALVRHVTSSLASVKDQIPRIMVMGAKGRCGKGCIEFARLVGIPETHITQWDIEETRARPGPYPEILEHDIFVNCIYLNTQIPPFLTAEMLSSAPNKRLSVIVDVSCDPNNVNNPIPVYSGLTTFDRPVVEAVAGKVKVIAIDHLPTLLPKEASDDFCRDLLPTLKSLERYPAGSIWSRAIELFQSKSSF